MKPGGLLRMFDASRRPDKTWEGFRSAAKAAIEIGERTAWISPDDMCERIEHEMAVRLRLKPAERGDIYTGLAINFVGCDRKTRTPQYRIESDWGWRIDVAGLITFELHKPLAR